MENKYLYNRPKTPDAQARALEKKVNKFNKTLESSLSAANKYKKEYDAYAKKAQQYKTTADTFSKNAYARGQDLTAIANLGRDIYSGVGPMAEKFSFGFQQAPTAAAPRPVKQGIYSLYAQPVQVFARGGTPKPQPRNPRPTMGVQRRMVMPQNVLIPPQLTMPPQMANPVKGQGIGPLFNFQPLTQPAGQPTGYADGGIVGYASGGSVMDSGDADNMIVSALKGVLNKNEAIAPENAGSMITNSIKDVLNKNGATANDPANADNMIVSAIKGVLNKNEAIAPENAPETPVVYPVQTVNSLEPTTAANRQFEVPSTRYNPFDTVNSLEPTPAATSLFEVPSTRYNPFPATNIGGLTPAEIREMTLARLQGLAPLTVEEALQQSGYPGGGIVGYASGGSVKDFGDALDVMKKGAGKMLKKLINKATGKNVFATPAAATPVVYPVQTVNSLEPTPAANRQFEVNSPRVTAPFEVPSTRYNPFPITNIGGLTPAEIKERTLARLQGRSPLTVEEALQQTSLTNP